MTPSYFRHFGVTFFLGVFFLFGCVTTEKKLDQKLQVEKSFYKGKAYLENKELQKAREEFARIIEIDNSNPKAHNALGAVYLAQNNQALAEKEFQTALSIDDGFFTALFNLSNLYLQQKRWDEAIASLRKLVELAPSFPEFHSYNLLGFAYYEKEDFNQAFRALKKSIHLNPNFFAAHFNMGLTLLALGYEDNAVKALIRTLELSSSFTPARHQLGMVYMKKGMYGKALPQFRMVIANSKDKKMVELAMEYEKIIQGLPKKKTK